MSYDSNCALCLTTEARWFLSVFSETNKNLNMAKIVSKHLWFDLKPSSNPCICIDCWTAVNEFHLYYTKLETIRNEGLEGETVSDNDMAQLKDIEFLEEDAEELRNQITQTPDMLATTDESAKRYQIHTKYDKTDDGKNGMELDDYSIVEIVVEDDEVKEEYTTYDMEYDEQSDGEIHKSDQRSSEPVILNGKAKSNVTTERTIIALDELLPLEQPVKRGRGRPRKVKPEQETDTMKAASEVKKEFRPNGSNAPVNSTSGGDTATATNVPVKRGRGRPPKNAKPQPAMSNEPSPRAIKKEIKPEPVELDSSSASRPERRSTRKRKIKQYSDMEQVSDEESDVDDNDYIEDVDPDYEARLELQKQLNMDDYSFYEYQCSMESEQYARDNKIFQYVDEFACYFCVDKVTFKRFADAHLHYRVEHDQPPFLKCPKCDKKCHTPGMFVSHMETHDDPEKNKCDICGKLNDCNISLKKHMRTHQSLLEENLPYPCSLCKRKFETEDLRAKHEKLHVPKPYIQKERGPDQEVLDFYKCIVCDICEEESPDSTSFDNLSELRAHMVKEHNKSMYVRCPVCSTRQANRQQVITHIDMHNNPEKYRCEVCKEVHQNLHHHMIKAHTPNTALPADEKHKCEQCGRTFNFIANLKMHIDCVHGLKDVRCNICNKYFNYKAYRAHKRSAHTDLMLMCELCPKMFKNRKSFEAHKVSHDSSLLRVTQCTLCGKQIRACSMSKHMKTIHSEDDPVNCDLCGKMFRTPFHMKRHQKNTCEVTMDSRSFKCEVCGKGFSTKLTMVEHMTTHTRTNQYQCAFCFKSFGYISNLYKHRKKAHPLEWQEVQAHPEENIPSVIVVRN
ncbi:zinc finger protein 728-like [Anopheles maculipalpis]|uniref:zinc finger protein 728-like n=1 Tax=Anopheles maculipalpis TaxID=1496333 RepID=UPI00215965F9|nr:zinc finger protein 728-like [Anopheles maculipalpis]